MRWPADRLDPAAYPGPGIDLPVFYGDLDTNRHVNNVMLGRFFEQGRVEAHHHFGLVKAVRASGGGLLIARVAIDYLAETHYGVGPVHARTRITTVGRSSLNEEQALWQNDSCVALAEVVAVHIQDGKPAAWPDPARAAMAALQVPATTA